MDSLRKARRATTALTAPLIALLLTSCASRVEISNRLPEGLLVPCEAPELNGETYADIIRLAARQRDALAECNERLKAIKGLNEDIKK